MLSAINHTANERFHVVWDLGRRCTYACSYCGPHRSNKTSPIINFESLKKTLDGVVQYTYLLNRFRSQHKVVDLNFTGGEPTVHPGFFDFIEYCKTTYPFLKTNVTTNGCYSEDKCVKIIQNLHSATISYHPEASIKEKELVLDNLQTMVDNNFTVTVNVMFHKDYFDECKNVVKLCNTLGIKSIARPIGDSSNKQDVEKGHAHEYTPEQLRYFNKDWSVLPNSVMAMATKKTSSQTIGRPCCNGKCLNVKNNDIWKKQKYVSNNNFNGWHCMVNWDFLYINSETNQVYFHQTCKVNLDGEIGPIGNADNFDSIISKFQKQFDTGNFPVIKCPKFYCGCGMCSPKAKDIKDAKQIFYEKTRDIQPLMVD